MPQYCASASGGGGGAAAALAAASALARLRIAAAWNAMCSSMNEAMKKYE